MTIALYILVMAGVTYLIRMIPFTFFRKKIKSRFFRSFHAVGEAFYKSARPAFRSVPEISGKAADSLFSVA